MEQLSQFVEEAITRPEVPEGLLSLMNQSPGRVAAYLAERFGRCSTRDECQRLSHLLNVAGPGGIAHLLELLQYGPPADAAATAGLLSRLDCTFLEVPLSVRLKGWNRLHQDMLVRQISLGSAPHRGRLLARLFPSFDAMVQPEVLDEIGLSGDRTATNLLSKLAAGELPQAADPYLRVKAIEALGRMGADSVAPLLRDIVTSRQFLGWANADEMRLVALQALEKIDPQWTHSYLPQSRLNARDLSIAPLPAAVDSPWARHRRYSRIALPKSLTMVAATPKGGMRMKATVLSLGGGMISSESPVPPGLHSNVYMQAGWRNLSANVLFREAQGQRTSFEIVDISLADRARLRRLLSSLVPAA